MAPYIQLHIDRPSRKGHIGIEKDFFTLMKAKSKLKLNKTCYVGQAILDLSKHLMYDFWYNQIKSQYGSRAQLLYTDTDSLLMVLETEDAYADMRQNAVIYDFSNYQKDHPCCSMMNKKVVGKFKDECANMVVVKKWGKKPQLKPSGLRTNMR